MDRPIISRIFLIILLVAVVIACYLIFKPFLIEIIAATILVSIFYTPYQQLTKLFRGRKNLAALVMCILVALVVIIPLTNFIVYAAQRSVVAYEGISNYINEARTGGVIDNPIIKGAYEYIFASEELKGVIIEVAKKLNDWFVSGATTFIRGTTSFFLSLALIIFTMFFFFVDGEKMVEKIMYWTPLPNKYDREIFKKFRDVSYSTVLSTFVTAAAQGLIGAIGLMIVGIPAFFAGVAMAFLSLLPYIGAAFVWFPVAIYLLVIGKIWQGIFLLVWGAGVVSVTDNLIRAYLIKGKAQVHPIFIIFSILGGIALFGFWGIIFGPLVISLAVTVFHIYELEYGKVLEK